VSSRPAISDPGGLRGRFVRRFWATHHGAPAAAKLLAQVLAELPQDGRGLNVGSGETRLDPRLLNLDLARGAAVDCVADALQLPFPRSGFALVVSQETVEHLPDPFEAVHEMSRVLQPGGTLYLQAPFVIGYHPGPEDYWRFTRAGMRRLVEQAGFRQVQVEPVIGAGTGFHRILGEFLAGLAARVLPATYAPAKGLAALVFYPLKWLDGWLLGGGQRDRIPGGYVAIGKK
jgi:SAM-dependent methyltransferase